jgi:hypothetical protein
MGRRRQPRIRSILPVRIWGADQEGKSFFEHVCTFEISGKGTRLAGVRARLSVGDSIGIQYRNRQARFRIKWIGAATAAGTHVGVECLQPEKDLWPIALPGEAPDAYRVPETGLNGEGYLKSDPRYCMRLPVSGKAYVSKINGTKGVWAKLADLSVTGCRIQTNDSIEVGHQVALRITVADTEIEATGVVRVCYPGPAEGIEFSSMSAASWRTLARLIARLEEVETARRRNSRVFEVLDESEVSGVPDGRRPQSRE